MKDKTALVVGGARGIGAAIVKALALEGAKVWIFDTDTAPNAINHYQSKQIGGYDAACTLAAHLNEQGHQVKALNVDACSEEAVIKGLQTISNEDNTPDFLVNALGITHMEDTVNTTTEQFKSILETNLIAPYIVCREVASAMIQEKKGGSILNIGSISGKAAFPGISSYCASKSGLGSFSTSLALELAEHNIQVNTICPGIVKTNMWKYLQGTLGESGESDEAFWNRMNEMIPQRKPQTPEGIAMLTVAILKNEEITGQSISIDGGMNRYG